MKKNNFSVLLITLLTITTGVVFYLSSPAPKRYQVVEITDGDTIKVIPLSKIKSFSSNNKDYVLTIRYIGVDTPELGRGEQENDCYAEQAMEINENLVLNKKIRLEFDKNKMDRFGRYLAYVYTPDKVFVNKYLLENGAGEFQIDTVNLKYQEILIEAAEKGHQQQKGLWEKCATDEEKCSIKGNLTKNDKRFYHLPHFRHYNQVKINLDKGDRWFCTEEDAVKAGFEKARE